MKRSTYLLTVLLLLCAVPVFAHCGMCGFDKKGSMSTEDRVAKKMEKMTAGLGLTEEQIPQVENLITEKLDKKKAIKDTMRKEMDAVREEFSANIKALLTDEQKEKYEAMVADWKKGSKKGSMKGSDHDHKGSDKGSGSEEKGSDSEMKGSN